MSRIRLRLLLALALALGACSSEEPPRPPAARTLPYDQIEARVSWAFLCATGAEITPSPVVGQTRITIRTAKGNLFMLSAPTWQVELAERNCAAFAERERTRRVIGE